MPEFEHVNGKHFNHLEEITASRTGKNLLANLAKFLNKEREKERERERERKMEGGSMKYNCTK